MLKYILKRLIVFIPTLFAISLLAFIISINAPGDPVESLSKSANKEGSANEQSSTTKKVKQEIRKRLGLDLPVFYFSLSTLSDCDTLYKIVDKSQQENLQKLTRIYGNWNAVSNYYNALNNALASVGGINAETIYKQNATITTEVRTINDSTFVDTIYTGKYTKNEINEAINNTKVDILALLESYNEPIIESKLLMLEKRYADNEFLQPTKETSMAVKKTFSSLKENATPWKTYIPSINFYGFSNNQYHKWLFGNASWFGKSKPFQTRGVLRGDFGISYMDSQPITAKIWRKFGISFIFVVLSILIAYLVSLPMGIFAAYKKDLKFDRYSSVILFVLYSMPGFFIGTLLLYTFANPDMLTWFPESGWQDPAIFNEDWNIFKRAAHHWPYMVLPLIAYTYSSFSFLSRLMRTSMIDVLGQDFIRTAKAKGLSESKIVIKHALRNSLIPIITVFANIFPMAIGGSVIIETIFTLPGMGAGTLQAVYNSDYPMIVAIFTITGFLTIVGYLVADILYAVVDPRISYS